MKTRLVCIIAAAPMLLCAAPREIGTHVPPPSTRGFTVESIRESGERGGMLLPVGTGFTMGYNQAMGEAMELWNQHEWQPAVEAFRAIYQNTPQSPWAAEAELHEACFLKFNCRYDEADERFLSVLAKNPASSDIRNKVLRYLPHLYAQTGRYHAALALLAEMEKLPLGWQEKQYVENYRRIFWAAARKENADRLCGTKALALALAAQNDLGENFRNVSMDAVYGRHGWAKKKAPHPEGFSLQDLAELGHGQPAQLDIEALRAAVRPGHPVLVHLKASGEPMCFSVFKKPGARQELPPSGHFVVVEKIAGAYVDLLDPDSARVRWPLAHFLYRWSGAALEVPGQPRLPGRPLSAEAARSLRGGCCGSPPPDPSNECGGDSSASGGTSSGNSSGGGRGIGGGSGGPLGGGEGCPSCGGGGDCPCQRESEGQGSPTYRFGLASANLSLKDIPLWTTNAKGPRMALQLIYSRVATQRMATNGGAEYYAFGNKWHCNFFSHLTENPGYGVDVVLPGGRVQQFLPDGADGFVPADVWNQNLLTRVNGQFILEFKETGSKWYFSTLTQNEQRLERMEDKYGNALTLSYDSSSGRLQSVGDAAGRSFQFSYDTNARVTNVVDSIGRNASFTYSNGDLVSLRDMGGLTTTIQYNENHWPTNIVYPSTSAIKLTYENGTQIGGFYADYPNADPVLSNPAVRIRAIDSLNQTNEYFYHAFWSSGPFTLKDRAGNNWLMASEGNPNSSLGQRIIYRGVNAYILTVDEDRSHQWSYDKLDASGNTVEADMATGAGDYVTCGGASAHRRCDVGRMNLFDARHNLLSSTLLTNCTISYPEPGVYTYSGYVVGTWTNWYDSRDNVIWTRNPLNQVTLYCYNDKDNLTAITNALNQVTRMTYDQNGNLTNMVDALLRTNRWFFNHNGLETNAIHPDGFRITKGYDSAGRLSATTNHGSGLYLQYYHDNLDRLRDVVFPDGTSNHSEYSCCGLDWTRDRLNRVTVFDRDALGRTTSVTDPQNRVTEFRYNGADQITNLITWVNNRQRVKRFDYTSTNGSSRLTKVTTPMGKTTRYDYRFRGELEWREDGNGNVTRYEHDPLERLTSVTDDAGVRLLSMEYDVLNNVTYVSNAHSIFQYTYDSLNRATQAVCILTNIPGFSTVKYRIDSTFDPVGNVTNRLITGLQGFTGTIQTRYLFDVMNRLTNVVQLTNGVATANAWYVYDSAGRLWKKGYGNGDVAWHNYDSESRLLSLGITNNTSLVACFNYLWDVGGNILAITNNTTNVTLYGYDRAGQLTNEISFTNGLAGFVTNSWQYDEAGNWLNPDLSGLGTKWVYNADNELMARTASSDSTWTTTVTGEVQPGDGSNKWYNTTAYCRGISARVSTNDGTFSLPGVGLYPGANELQVTVTDVSGNTSQQTRTVTRNTSSCLEIFGYDGNGNLTNWVNGSQNWAYEWDWADRLTKVSSNGVVMLENWYDASSRRIARNERIGGSMVGYLSIYDGWDIVALVNTSGAIHESYTRGVSIAGDIGGLVSVTRHPFNTQYYVHNNHRGDVIHVRSGPTTTTTYRYSAFGQLVETTGPNYCRFKFSSKELNASCGLYYYGYRFYAPQWQRWMNRDRINESGDLNLYRFCANAPSIQVDSRGLAVAGGIATLVRLGATALMKKCDNCSTRERCETCCAALFLVGNAALQGLLVGDAGEVLALVEVPPLAVADAVISTAVFLWNTYNLSSAYHDCAMSCKTLPPKASEAK